MAALVVVLVAVACGDGGPEIKRGATSTTERSVPSTTNATSSAERAAVKAYNAMWSDMVVAARTADYQSPRLSDHASGDALSQLARGLYANKQHGVIAKGQPATRPTVTSATPTSAEIADCFDDSRWLNYEASTGALQNGVPGGKHATTATVTLTDGAWRVTQLAVGAVGTC
jgi:hypothetical protein